ncbi:hypothetical protein QAD02_006289 [Eretmocerus hayati]|uniref:Uncharacterized protein n=1 Tax=Eretmocerus hayati TaxID=131215 RepID=A0ACC2N0U8_9HYME|nr:hypothetical protein QAD02_006289 [Eretmocerus hayati]
MDFLTTDLLILLISLTHRLHILKANPIVGFEVHQVRKGELPFVVSILEKSSNADSEEEHIGGGTLISKKHVLTAAHCLENLALDQISILAGSPNLSACKAPRFKPASIMNYSSWAEICGIEPRVVNDIAVIELDVDDTGIPSTSLIGKTNNEDFVGVRATFAGWGVANDGKYPKIMQKVTLIALSNAHCQQKIDALSPKYGKFRMFDELICFKAAERWAAAAPGDSGHAVLDENFRIIGIHVCSYPLPGEQFPDQISIMLRVNPYSKFISDMIQDNKV